VVFNDGTRAKGKLCLRNVTLTYPIKAATDTRKDAALWLDGVTYKGPGASKTGSDVSRFDAGEFWTRCKVSDLHLAGASGLIYDTTFERIGEDLIRGAYAVVKVKVSDCRDFSAHGKWHGDFVVNPNGADEPLLFYDI